MTKRVSTRRTAPYFLRFVILCISLGIWFLFPIRNTILSFIALVIYLSLITFGTEALYNKIKHAQYK